MSIHRVGIDLQGALQLLFFTGRIAVQYSSRLSKVAVRLGVAFIQGEGLLCGSLHFRIGFERFYIRVRQPNPGFRDTDPSPRRIWILLERALKKVETLAQLFFGTLVRKIQTLQIKIVGLGVLTCPPGRRDRELDLERIDN